MSTRRICLSVVFPFVSALPALSVPMIDIVAVPSFASGIGKEYVQIESLVVLVISVVSRSSVPAKSTAICGLVAIPSLNVTVIVTGLSSNRTNESAGTMAAVGASVSMRTSVRSLLSDWLPAVSSLV